MAPRTKTSTRKIEGERSRTKENSELKQENHRLKKQVKRLRKQLERNIRPVDVEESPVPLEEGKVVEESPSMKCAACGHKDFSEFKTPGGKSILSCKNCKVRV